VPTFSFELTGTGVADVASREKLFAIMIACVYECVMYHMYVDTVCACVRACDLTAFH